MNVKGTKILQDAEGIYNNINFVYMNRGWIEKNEDTAVRFIRALVEANDLLQKDRPAATVMVSKFLKMPIELTRELMPKMEFDMNLTDRSLGAVKISEDQLRSQGKMKAPLD
jgi:ABC-type nitrate/sulfonate/bicarbonate transport system substrate-binding protein